MSLAEELAAALGSNRHERRVKTAVLKTAIPERGITLQSVDDNLSTTLTAHWVEGSFWRVKHTATAVTFSAIA